MSAALERRDRPLESFAGGVLRAGVLVAAFRSPDPFLGVRRCLVDRRRDGASQLVRLSSGMDGEGVEPEVRILHGGIIADPPEALARICVEGKSATAATARFSQAESRPAGPPARAPRKACVPPRCDWLHHRGGAGRPRQTCVPPRCDWVHHRARRGAAGDGRGAGRGAGPGLLAGPRGYARGICSQSHRSGRRRFE